MKTLSLLTGLMAVLILSSCIVEADPTNLRETKPVSTCEFNGQQLKVGESAMDRCNTCTCEEEGLSCTEMRCGDEPDGCEVNGTIYAEGESFACADGCNTCYCGAGGKIRSTLMACNKTEVTNCFVSSDCGGAPGEYVCVDPWMNLYDDTQPEPAENVYLRPYDSNAELLVWVGDTADWSQAELPEYYSSDPDYLIGYPYYSVCELASDYEAVCKYNNEAYAPGQYLFKTETNEDCICNESGEFECSVIYPVCPAVYDPVCGVDGLTYANSCEANAVSVAYAGECLVTEPIDCWTDDDCPAMYHCGSIYPEPLRPVYPILDEPVVSVDPQMLLIAPDPGQTIEAPIRIVQYCVPDYLGME